MLDYTNLGKIDSDNDIQTDIRIPGCLFFIYLVINSTFNEI